MSRTDILSVLWVKARCRSERGLLNKNVAREETEMSAWPRQPRARQEIPPGLRSYGCKHSVLVTNP